MSIQEFGQHRVRHGDVTDAKGIVRLMGGDRATIMYSDPPWGEGNIKYWATMNKKMTGDVVEPAPLSTFLDSIFDIAEAYVDRWLVVEYGVRWRSEIQTRGVNAGFIPRDVIEIQYRSGSKMLPLDLHVFSKVGLELPEGYSAGVKGTSGYSGVKAAIGPLARACGSPERSVTLLDPCCGMGYTAQAALDFGCRFIGNELNSKRLAKTIRRLSK